MRRNRQLDQNIFLLLLLHRNPRMSNFVAQLNEP